MPIKYIEPLNNLLHDKKNILSMHSVNEASLTLDHDLQSYLGKLSMHPVDVASLTLDQELQSYPFIIHRETVNASNR